VYVCICVGEMVLMIHGGIGLGLCVVDILRTTLFNIFSPPPSKMLLLPFCSNVFYVCFSI